MPVPFFVQLAIGIGLNILAYVLAPKPKPPKPPSLDDFKKPTSSAGRPLTVVTGSITITGPNCISYHDKRMKMRKVKYSKK